MASRDRGVWRRLVGCDLLEMSNKRGVVSGGEALPNHLQHPGHVAPHQRRHVQPQPRKLFAAEPALGEIVRGPRPPRR